MSYGRRLCGFGTEKCQSFSGSRFYGESILYRTVVGSGPYADRVRREICRHGKSKARKTQLHNHKKKFADGAETPRIPCSLGHENGTPPRTRRTTGRSTPTDTGRQEPAGPGSHRLVVVSSGQTILAISGFPQRAGFLLQLRPILRRELRVRERALKVTLRSEPVLARDRLRADE